ncbi:hypothetical protein A9267_17595 [Shewanella sp. UCD-FRSSP16_17]|uniref:antibiotic biosynthesis monooxygenase family protein n=1 Tax=unclassified Shewanella TaxID=196818 RepID=UPI0007EEAB4A|nr:MULTISPECIES: antibiotic biosynthesis monooxygenase family protein [unclassified Shewanella]MBQ4891402.1 antibiotic biosynthesis monooxygenase [Shewanella sp. MMG014]OBT04757.1 hypothetical protein A9267_17595 [Shewanella sp. UCD-FRSSP16_17]
MSFFTMLEFTAHDGDGKRFADLHIERRCVEEAAETIPGFLHGETMLSKDDPAKVLVMCTWENEQAYQQWLDSPVRAKQTEDLIHKVSVDAKTTMFTSIHIVTK